jgi:hypothetical protein
LLIHVDDLTALKARLPRYDVIRVGHHDHHTQLPLAYTDPPNPAPPVYSRTSPYPTPGDHTETHLRSRLLPSIFSPLLACIFVLLATQSANADLWPRHTLLLIPVCQPSPCRLNHRSVSALSRGPISLVSLRLVMSVCCLSAVSRRQRPVSQCQRNFNANAISRVPTQATEV